MNKVIKEVKIGDYLVTEYASGEINISGGIDTYIGWNGSFDSAVETVKTWIRG